MTEEKKRDLIRFITNRIMDWHVNDFGQYIRNVDGVAVGLYLKAVYRDKTFNPIDNANHRDMVVDRMKELGFWSKQFTLIDRENREGEYAAKFVSVESEAVGSYASPTLMGIAVCVAAQRAILRQDDLAKGEPRYWLDEIKALFNQEKESHGN
jgi:hypothetical protein